MAVPNSADFAQVLALLREGKVQDADQLTQDLRDAAADAEREARGEPKPPPEPRAVEPIVTDLFHAIVAQLGFPQRLQALLDEFKAAAAPK